MLGFHQIKLYTIHYKGKLMPTDSIGKVIELFISKKGSSTRINKKSLAFDKKGILEDKYYNTNIQRSVLISSTTSYNIVKQHQIDFSFGLLGENILIDYNPYHLSTGYRLQIGSVILEISQNCTMCEHLSNIDERLPILLKKDRGIFAKVIQEGKIYINDVIILL